MSGGGVPLLLIMDKPHRTRDSRGGKTGQDQSLSILPRHPPNIKVSPSLPPEDRQDSSTWKLLETPRGVASTNYGPLGQVLSDAPPGF